MPITFFCLFSTLQNINTKRSPNATKLFEDFFWQEETSEASSGHEKMLVGPTRHQGTPGAFGASWWVVGPMGIASNYLQLYKYSKIPKTLGESTKHFSSHRKFQNHEIQSGGLFRHSAGGGNDHGGVLHHPCCPSDDA